MLCIAAIFMIGADWTNEKIRILFHSYFADIAIPFGYYMLLFLVEDKFKVFQKWYSKALAIFLLCSLSECLQYFGIYALANTFDPIDYLMYAFSVLLAAFFDRIIFKRLFSAW